MDVQPASQTSSVRAVIFRAAENLFPGYFALVMATGVISIASHLLATAIKTLVKRSVDRTRPHSVKDGRQYKLKRGKRRSHHYSSFPSGHTAGAVAVARAAARVWPQATPALAAAEAGAGALQLPIGKHYASDVAAGAVIGLVSEGLVHLIARPTVHAIDRVHTVVQVKP